jgi:hypothetical protein
MKTKKILLFALAVSLLAGCSDKPHWKTGLDPGDTDTDTDVDTGPAEAGPLVEDVTITAIDLYQAVRVRLMEDGDEVTDHPVPIVAGRDATMRVFVELDAGFTPRDLVARVSFTGTSPSAVQAQAFVDADSTETNYSSTLNVEIPGDKLDSDVLYTVSVREVGDSMGGSSSGAIWPSSGYAGLDTQENGEPLQMVLVPVRYNADGSGRLPDTSDGQLGLYEELLFTIYPVTGVDLILHEPMDWNGNVSAFGGGWVELLNAITQLRQTDGAPTEQYYYGLFSPANSIGEFCGWGCIAGMSNLAMNPGDSWARASIGLGFPGEMSGLTLVHEVGHAHGREHAPCGLGGQPSDPGYPHPGAAIGEWGLDIENGTLKDPNTFKDFMSYCDPDWVSDYTFDGLFNRVAAVNALADVAPSSALAGRWLSVSVDLYGQVTLGPELELQLPPEGEETTLELIDGYGVVVDAVPGIFRPFADLPGGLVLFPEPSADIVAVQIPGYPAVQL